MSAIVDPQLAAMAAELASAWTAVVDKHAPNMRHHAPFGLELRTVDGIAARFYEEGIEFYPPEPS